MHQLISVIKHKSQFCYQYYFLGYWKIAGKPAECFINTYYFIKYIEHHALTAQWQAGSSSTKWQTYWKLFPNCLVGIGGSWSILKEGWYCTIHLWTLNRLSSKDGVGNGWGRTDSSWWSLSSLVAFALIVTASFQEIPSPDTSLPPLPFQHFNGMGPFPIPYSASLSPPMTPLLTPPPHATKQNVAHL